MNNLGIIYNAFLVSLLLSVSVAAQDITQSDSTSNISSDSLSATIADSVDKPVEKIRPWKFSDRLGFKEVTNDSLLRWQIWPSWSDWYSRRNDVISYRQGTVGRNDAFVIEGIEPRFQKITWNGININDPVSGFINLSEIPHHKLSRVTQYKGLGYQNDVFFKNYYVVKPITNLNFDESKFEYRNLEFVFARNLSQKTNLELSFWDRRDGGFFQRNEVEGSQVFGRLVHHLNNRWLVQALYLRNEFDREESFGYQLPTNLQTFTFDRFTTSPVVNNGSSKLLNSTWSVGIHNRGENSSEDDFMLSVHRKRNDNSLTYTADTTFYDVKNIGLRTRKWMRVGNLSLEAGGRLDTFDAQDTSSVSLSSWTEWNADARVSTRLLDKIELGGYAQANGRDGNSSTEIGANGFFKPTKKLSLSLDASLGEKLPTVQQLFWRSRFYAGNTQLQNESIQTAGAELVYSISPDLKVGVKGRFRSIENGVLLGLDSTFTNVSSYETVSATGFGVYNDDSWEGSLSSTITQFSSSGTEALAQRINTLQPTVLIKGSAFIKGTIYNGATFVKAGFVGTFSPNLTETYSYVPDLGNWRLISDSAQNPSYFRLDMNISARLRSIFIVMRWENLLDGLAQQGYFESVGYPLSPRRFITGIRVLFRD